MSSAANHRKRSHRSAAKHYQANRSMRAYAADREYRKEQKERIKDWFFRGFMARFREKKGEEST